MKRKIMPLTMLILLLVSAIDFVSISFIAQAASPESGSIDWWFMFRHYENHTGYSLSNVTMPIVSLKNLTTDGEIRSSPAVVNDVVFVGSVDGYVYRWNVTADTSMKSAIRFGAIHSSPAVVEDVVYIGSNDSYVHALNAINLATIQNYATGGTVKSSPLVVEGVLYAGSSDNYTYAWEASSGKVLWKFWTASPIESSPAFFDNTIFFGTNDGRVYALEKTGRIRWYFNTTGAVTSSPAVANGIVFVGSNDNKTYAINATTGEHIWNYTTGGPVTSSPAIAKGTVFVGSNDMKVYAINATTGAKIWGSSTGGAVTSSPAVTANGMVFVGSCDNKVYAFNASDGDEIWKNITRGPIYSSPAIANGMVFVGSDDEGVHVFGTENKRPVAIFTHYPDNPIICNTVTFDASASFDPDGNIPPTAFSWKFGDGKTAGGKVVTHVYETARIYNVNLTVTDNGSPSATNSTSQLITVLEAWPMFRHDPKHWANSTSVAPVTNMTLWNKTIGTVTYSSPAVIDSTVFICSTNGILYALNATTNGAVIWSRSLGDPIHSSPAVLDNMVFIASENGTISAWDVNGNFIWTNHTQGKIYSSPTVSGNTVFIGSQDSHLYAFDKTNGNERWPAVYLGGAVDSSPAVASGRVFVGSWNGTVYAIDETNGKIIKKYVIGAQIRVKSSPTVACGKVFIGAGNGKIYALDMDCKLQWQNATGGAIDSSPAVSEGKVFVGSRDGKMYAFNATTGNNIWNKTIGIVGWSSPAVAEGKVFVGTRDGKIYALREEDGTILWSYKTSGAVDSSPAVLDDKLYIGSEDGKLYAFGGKVHDVAIFDISAPPKVTQNVTIDIAVTMENQGSFDETDINVTAQYYDKIFYNTSINLNRGEERSLLIPWNTTDLEGNYTIYVNATLAPSITDNDPADNTKYVNITVEGVHDINVTDVKLKRIVCQNCTVTIYVTVRNEGNYTEYNINVTAYWSNSTHINQTIGSIIIPKLLNKTSVTVSITWSTSGIAKGDYNISAYATPVQGETNTMDNTLADSRIFLTILGDVNGDRKVDITDITMTIAAYGKTIKSPGWYEPTWYVNRDVAPLNGDDKVDISDISTVISQYGKHDC